MTSKNQTPDPDLIIKEKQVVELRRAGATWDEIAKAVDYATPTGAWKAFQRAMRRTLVDAGTEELRALELDRLDRVQRAVWAKALTGDDKAIDKLLKIMEHRAKYLGLYAPAKVQVESVVYDGSTIEGEVAKLRQLLADSGSQQISLDRHTGET